MNVQEVKDAFAAKKAAEEKLEIAELLVQRRVQYWRPDSCDTPDYTDYSVDHVSLHEKGYDSTEPMVAITFKHRSSKEEVVSWYSLKYILDRTKDD